MADYVVVGAGSAGCVLACRLTEDPDVRVLLLEAGPPDSSPNIHIPLGFTRNFRTQVDWDLATHPEPQLQRRRLYLPRGRTLGGSSSINAMIRGNRADYDGWARTGCAGWGFADLLPHFKRAEDNERGADDWHDAGGPLRVSDGRSRNPIAAAFVEAAVQAGMARNEDFNGPEQDGAGWYQATQRDGLRCSTAVAYLHPVAERPNLELLTGAQVHRILFDGTRAIGVEGERCGEPLRASAEREVLLCAGTYHSPQLLMLSGVGDPAQLASQRIAVTAELPEVGANLADHLSAGAVWTTDAPVSLLVATLEPERCLRELHASGSGPLTSCIAEAGAFERSDPGLPAPDRQFHAVPAAFPDEGLGEIVDHGVTLTVCVLQPESRGSVALASADPTAKPRIRHNYLSTQRDVDRLLDGMRRLLEIAAQPALARYAKTPHAVPASGGDRDLLRHIRATAQTLYHPVGTCAMGRVVDSELRVLGVEGLRVVDASVMPAIPRGNTNAPVIAIAERAADLIRG
jgi:choline dehydrogenase-like flavoprotein